MGAPLDPVFRDTFQGVMHVSIGLFLTQGREKDCDCGSQSGPSFSGSLHCVRRAFIGSILNGTTGEDGGHLLTQAFVPDSCRMKRPIHRHHYGPNATRILCSYYRKDGGDSGRVHPYEVRYCAADRGDNLSTILDKLLRASGLSFEP